MTISVRRTKQGRLLVKLNGKRTSLSNAAKIAITENRDEFITIANEYGCSYNYAGHIHAYHDTYSLGFDCSVLEDAVRNFADVH